jgi:hypothetical protein
MGIFGSFRDANRIVREDREATEAIRKEKKEIADALDQVAAEEAKRREASS